MFRWVCSNADDDAWEYIDDIFPQHPLVRVTRDTNGMWVFCLVNNPAITGRNIARTEVMRMGRLIFEASKAKE